MEIMRMIANRQIYPVYQPIIDASKNKTIGYEALARSPKNMSAETMFDEAEKCGLIRNLDALCVYNAIENAPNGKPIFVNIMPYTLVWLIVSGKISRVLDKVSTPIVFELVEIERISGDLSELISAAEKIREWGFKIAIDDISQGFNRLQVIPLLCPDYIKIDRTLSTNCSMHHNVIKKNIVNMAKEMGSTVIAEGIETEQEFTNLLNLGVDIFQGYYFAKPGEEFSKKEASKEKEVLIGNV